MVGHELCHVGPICLYMRMWGGVGTVGNLFAAK